MGTLFSPHLLTSAFHSSSQTVTVANCTELTVTNKMKLQLVQLLLFHCVLQLALCRFVVSEDRTSTTPTSTPNKQKQKQSKEQEQEQDDPRNHHAVILSSSRYWFNYRHTANALSIYQLLRSQGFPDDHIVLMIADEYGVNPRNPVKNRIYNTARDGPTTTHSFYQRPALLRDDTQIDYRGEDVTVDNFVRVLTGRGGYGSIMPVLTSDEHSHVLVYLTGHGGDSFFKFQDVEEILAEQLAETVHQMHVAGKYQQLMIIADTCQAFTLFDKIIERQVPNVSMIGSSLREQSSYAHKTDPVLGLSVIEKYTHFFTEYIRTTNNNDQSLFEALIAPYTRQMLGADLGWAFTSGALNFTKVPLRDFFVNTAVAIDPLSGEKVRKMVGSPTSRLLVIDPPASSNWTLSASKSTSRIISGSISTQKSADSTTCDALTESVTERQCVIRSHADNSTIRTTTAVGAEGFLDQCHSLIPATEPSHPIFVSLVVLALASALIASLVW